MTQTLEKEKIVKPLIYGTGKVTSADGTTIGYIYLGSGPALVIEHGGMQYSKGYMRLAEALADSFTVYLLDRRGRGLSGQRGLDYAGMATELQDLKAVLEKSGAEYAFGHSSGALITLQAALKLPGLRKIALYEPPLSTNGSVPSDWQPRFNREIEKGHAASALITMLRGLHLAESFEKTPRPLLTLMLGLGFRKNKKSLKSGDVATADIIPTQVMDNQLVLEMEGKLPTFKELRPGVLLLGGENSPAFLRQALEDLSGVVPNSQLVILPDQDHSGPQEGAPELVAAEIEKYFRE